MTEYVHCHDLKSLGENPSSAQTACGAAWAQHGKEICQILDDAVRSETDLKIGSALAAFGKQHGGLDLEITRDQNLATPTSFE